MYQITISYARSFHRKYPDDDEYQLWRSLETFFTNHCLSTSHWNGEILPGGVIHQTFTDKVLSLPEKYIDGYRETDIIPSNHYMIEIFRTPLENEPTLKNIMNIAYNVGLALSHIRQRDFPEGLVKTFKSLKAYNLVSFIAPSCATKLNEELDRKDDIVDSYKKEFIQFLKAYAEERNKTGMSSSEEENSE